MIDQTYKNSCQQAQTALETSPIYELRGLSVRFEDESIHLSGLVSCFYHKQLAQEVVRAYADKKELVNEIDVQMKKPR